MGSRIANTRSRSLRLAAIGVIAGVAVVSLPGVAMAIPATDEYTLDYPDAKGEKVAGAVAPEARPSQLTSETRDALAKSADGKLLATIATATEVGAPGEGGAGGGGGADDAGSGGTGDDGTPSFVGAAAGATGDAPVPFLVLALAAIVLVGFLVRSRVRRQG